MSAGLFFHRILTICTKKFMLVLFCANAYSLNVADIIASDSSEIYVLLTMSLDQRINKRDVLIEYDSASVSLFFTEPISHLYGKKDFKDFSVNFTNFNSIYLTHDDSLFFIKHEIKENKINIFFKREKKDSSSESISYFSDKKTFPSIKILIDPGHGGKDPGTINSLFSLMEKDVVLSISKHVYFVLKGMGYNVSLTRNDDSFVTLQRRLDVCNEFDLCVSIHADSSGNLSQRGCSVYFSDSSRGGSRVLGMDLVENNRKAQSILRYFALQEKKKLSRKLAKSIINEMKLFVNPIKRPLREASLYVLQSDSVPSVLVEVGFLSNAQDALLLKREQYKKKIASAIVKGIQSYVKETFL